MGFSFFNSCKLHYDLRSEVTGFGFCRLLRLVSVHAVERLVAAAGGLDQMKSDRNEKTGDFSLLFFERCVFTQLSVAAREEVLTNWLLKRLTSLLLLLLLRLHLLGPLEHQHSCVSLSETPADDTDPVSQNNRRKIKEAENKENSNKLNRKHTGVAR